VFAAVLATFSIAQNFSRCCRGPSEAPILFCPGALHGSIQQHVQDAPPPPVPRGHFLLPLPFSPDQIARRGIRKHQHHFAATSSSSRGILCVDSVESRHLREMGYSSSPLSGGIAASSNHLLAGVTECSKVLRHLTAKEVSFHTFLAPTDRSWWNQTFSLLRVAKHFCRFSTLFSVL